MLLGAFVVVWVLLGWGLARWLLVELVAPGGVGGAARWLRPTPALPHLQPVGQADCQRHDKER